MNTYDKDGILDLLDIIKHEGSCENVPCYSNDCPIWNMCNDNWKYKEHVLGVDKQRLRYCKEELATVPKEQLFEALL